MIVRGSNAFRHYAGPAASDKATRVLSFLMESAICFSCVSKNGSRFSEGVRDYLGGMQSLFWLFQLCC